jgi:hypothetical protein
LGSEGRRRTPCDNDVNFELNKLGRQVRQPLDNRIGISALDGNVLTLNITKLVQPAVEWFENCCRWWGAWHQYAYSRHVSHSPDWLLRLRGKRPRGR